MSLCSGVKLSCVKGSQERGRKERKGFRMLEVGAGECQVDPPPLSQEFSAPQLAPPELIVLPQAGEQQREVECTRHGGREVWASRISEDESTQCPGGKARTPACAGMGLISSGDVRLKTYTSGHPAQG